MLIVDDALEAIALIAEVLKSYSLMFHTLPSPVKVIPLFNTAELAPMPNEMVFEDRLTITSPFLLALDATACADEVPTVANVGVEAVKGVFVLTVPVDDDRPTPGFCNFL
jgi:hypothetical protein